MAIIVIDFDNTITDAETYPECSNLRKDAKEIINKYYNLGHCIIVNTCRCDEPLEIARNFLIQNNIKFCHINENCNMRILKYQNDTRKIGGDIFIDDKDINIKFSGDLNWKDIDKKLEFVLKDEPFKNEICQKRGL